MDPCDTAVEEEEDTQNPDDVSAKTGEEVCSLFQIIIFSFLSVVHGVQFLFHVQNKARR